MFILVPSSNQAVFSLSSFFFFSSSLSANFHENRSGFAAFRGSPVMRLLRATVIIHRTSWKFRRVARSWISIPHVLSLIRCYTEMRERSFVPIFAESVEKLPTVWTTGGLRARESMFDRDLWFSFTEKLFTQFTKNRERRPFYIQTREKFHFQKLNSPLGHYNSKENEIIVL